MSPLLQAVSNAGALWATLGEARGHEVIRRPSFLAVAGDEHSGVRVLLLSPEPSEADVAELTALVRDRGTGPAIVEDPFGSVDMGEVALAPRQLPIMVRNPGEPFPPPAMEVTRVTRPDQLEIAEEVVVRAFPMEHFQPYRPGQMFPRAMLERPEADLFLIARDGEMAGACLTVIDADVGGVYWVTTLPEHRSKGVGRALMHVVLNVFQDRPVTLTAATAGKPLYGSLGFATVTQATWWV